MKIIHRCRNWFYSQGFKTLSDTNGKYVNITQIGGKITKGYFIGVNNEGGLIIEKQNCSLKKIISDELRIAE